MADSTNLTGFPLEAYRAGLRIGQLRDLVNETLPYAYEPSIEVSQVKDAFDLAMTACRLALLTLGEMPRRARQIQEVLQHGADAWVSMHTKRRWPDNIEQQVEGAIVEADELSSQAIDPTVGKRSAAGLAYELGQAMVPGSWEDEARDVRLSISHADRRRWCWWRVDAIEERLKALTISFEDLAIGAPVAAASMALLPYSFDQKWGWFCVEIPLDAIGRSRAAKTDNKTDKRKKSAIRLPRNKAVTEFINAVNEDGGAQSRAAIARQIAAEFKHLGITAASLCRAELRYRKQK